MSRKRVLFASAFIAIMLLGTFIFALQQPGRAQVATEPKNLRDIVEFPPPNGAYMRDLEGPERDEAIMYIQGMVEGFFDVYLSLKDKGYNIDYHTNAIVSSVEGMAGESFFTGYSLSCWSGDGPNGTRAFIAAAIMYDGTNLVMGATTNLLPPEQVPGVDPYIIVNAMPYIYIDWYWWRCVYPKYIVHWRYWWYNSHNHPNWFWGCYWWWRIYVRYYCVNWYPWWWWWWHWIYWRHWYWWSTYFPYIW